MPIVVNSPFSGRPVKVRDQDVGRAVRDEEGRIFYLVQRTEGSGYYAAPTRKGSEKDEQRYDAMVNKSQIAHDTFIKESATQVHDATGKRRPLPLMRIGMLLLILLAAGAVAYFFLVLDGDTSRLPFPLPTPPAPTQPETREQSADAPFALGPGPVPAVPVTVTASAALELQTFTSDAVDDYRSSASGLRIRVDQPGRGQIATAGAYVRIRYEVSLPKGPVLDSIWQGEPFGFVLWSGQVIRGWDEGIAGMAEGEIRSLIIPSHLITGAPSTQGNPSNQLPATTLYCRIQLVEVLPGVTVQIDQPGQPQGLIARPGDRVAITFTGQVQGHPKPFSSSDDLGGPLRFTLGQGQVISGWELGVVGMAEGETRTLTIPPYLAYGQRGFGQVIPPQATLIYHVTLEKRTP